MCGLISPESKLTCELPGTQAGASYTRLPRLDKGLGLACNGEDSLKSVKKSRICTAGTCISLGCVKAAVF